jgi:outer membrane protein OmpA-like peptidoglycan-associated protein
LIVNMSDVVFATGSYQIKTSAQIKLARIAGILMTYPGLKVQVEGYTDNVGSAAFNQKLSDQRANAVMQFLISQGVKAGSISAKGYGEADPVASNSTASGRAQNRRVQLVVSGAAIGTKQQAPPPSAPPPPANPTGVSNPPQPY